MAETSGSIGSRRDMKVRVGATLRPQVLTLRLASGQILNAQGGGLVASLYRRETDVEPITDVKFDIQRLSAGVNGEPRFLLSLSKEKVLQLASLAPASPSLRTGGSRTVWWTCGFQDSTGAVTPIYYGQLLIFLGGSGG